MKAMTDLPSIKVVALGRANAELVANLANMPNVECYEIYGANYCWDEYIRSPDSLAGAPFIKAVSPTKNSGETPVLKKDWKRLAADMKNLGAVKDFVHGFEQEMRNSLYGADMVLLVISLDCAMSYAACEMIAKIAYSVGALTIALVGTPYDDFFPDATHNAINGVLNEADSVMTSNGYWAVKQGDLTKWHWYDAMAKELLWNATKSATDFNLMKQMFTKSGLAAYGVGVGDNTNEAIEMAFDSLWFECYRYQHPVAATAGLVTVSADWSSMADVLTDAKTTLSYNAPLTRTGRPYWRETQQIIVSAAQWDPCAGPGVGVSIISTGVAFE